MANSGSKTRHGRIAAAVLATLILAFAVLTYLSYTAAFTSTDSVTVTSPRAGLVMEKDAKVKYRGIQIGKVKDIAYSGDQAKLTLAIDSNQMRYIPIPTRKCGSPATRSSAPSRWNSFRRPSRRERRCAQTRGCRSRRCNSRSTRCSRRWKTCCTRSTRST